MDGPKILMFESAVRKLKHLFTTRVKDILNSF